jgi:ATP-dependent DNA helicase DinG
MHEIAKQAMDPAGKPLRALVEEFYGPTGPLAEMGWEIRSQQVQMSLGIVDLVEARAKSGRDEEGNFISRIPQWGFVEAPCGTGKGLAYGVPGVLMALRAKVVFNAAVARAKKAGTRVPTEPPKLLVSTANIALQEQLVKKDFPALARMLGIEDVLKVVLLKSRQNYLCRYKIRALGGELIADEEIAKLLRWSRLPECSGDKEDLTWDSGWRWQEMAAGSDECTGDACAHFTEKDEPDAPKLCFWRRAIRGYLTAHVVVTNHHYLCVAGKLQTCLLAVDESHDLEDCLRSTATGQVTPFSGKTLAGRVRVAGLSEDEAKAAVDRPVKWLMDRAAEWVDAQQIPGQPAQDMLKMVPGWLGADQPEAERYANGLEDLLGDVAKACFAFGCSQFHPRVMKPPKFDDSEVSDKGGKLAKTWEQLLALSERYRAVINAEPCTEWPGCDDPWAFWFEQVRGKTGEIRVNAKMSPADVSWATSDMAAKYPLAVFTTATMPDYEPQRIALGFGTRTDDEGKKIGAPVPTFETRLPSPFPLAEQGVLVVPQGPEPNDVAWPEWATRQVVETVKLAGGGVLVLASSMRQMNAYATALRNAASGQPWDVRVQGESGRAELRNWFRDDRDGVLVATRSFFQGLDVQGDSCRCVVIDRVPFARPDDPMEEAVGKLLVSRALDNGLDSPSAYTLRSIPQAAMVLAQGAGRLIRSQTDRGVVVLLDNRVLKFGIGWQTLKAALPPFPMSRDLRDVANQLAGRPLAGVAQAPRGRVLRRGAA